jgi:hypothetical protein
MQYAVRVQAALDSAGFTPGYFENDLKARSEKEPDFSLVDPIKGEQDEPYGFDSLAYSPDYCSSHKIRPGSFFKRMEIAALKVNVFHKEEHVEFGPRRLSLLGEPKFKFPTHPTAAVVLPGSLSRTPTPSMMSQLSNDSSAVVSYAHRSPVSSAVARTLTLDKKSSAVKSKLRSI